MTRKSLPEWTKADDPGLQRIALTDRQWNRQQVSFAHPSPHVEASWGNGFEKTHLASAELAKNCLNAGLWEVLLYVQEDGRKALYYHGWFTFPLGHYAHLFERNTGLPYWRHFYYLEHWDDPAGTPLHLDGLRRVKDERPVPATFLGDEEIVAAGEQVGKRRDVIADNLVSLEEDYYDGRKVAARRFRAAGPLQFQSAVEERVLAAARSRRRYGATIISPATEKPLQELELVFTGKGGGTCRILVNGFDLHALPLAARRGLSQGTVPADGHRQPAVLSELRVYATIRRSLARTSAWRLDEDDHWLNHHELAVDGVVLHRDADDPEVLHVYLLSYERHAQRSGIFALRRARTI